MSDRDKKDAADGLLRFVTPRPDMTDEESRDSAIDPESVFEALRRDQETGELAKLLADGRVWYESSRSHPGLIDRVQPDGTRETGRMINGHFVPIKKQNE